MSIYNSIYTGEQIDERLGKTDDIVKIVPNTDEGIDDDLRTIEIDDVVYRIPSSVNVVGNDSVGIPSETLNTITIGNKTYLIPKGVDVIGNPSSTTPTEELNSIKIGNVTYSIPENTPAEIGTEVVANPAGTPSINLTKVKIDDTIYGIPSGTKVIANPSGGSTTYLRLVSIDGSYYKIPSEVQGNPSNSAQVDLRRLKIGTVVYAIPPKVEPNAAVTNPNPLTTMKVGDAQFNLAFGKGKSIEFRNVGNFESLYALTTEGLKDIKDIQSSGDITLNNCIIIFAQLPSTTTMYPATNLLKIADHHKVYTYLANKDGYVDAP